MVVVTVHVVQWVGRYGLKALGLTNDDLIVLLPPESRRGYKHVTTKVQ